MRLLVANANTTGAITQLCAAAARKAAAPGVEVVPCTPRFGPEVIATRAEDAIASHGILDALAPHAGKVDAVLLAVSIDTALEAARQLMPCPVVGMTEAACFVACLTGGRFGLVTTGGTAHYRDRIERHGLLGRLAGLAGVEASAQDAVRDPEAVAALLLPEIAALGRAGADSVILGGAALAGMAEWLQARTGVVLLDGIACGVALAQALVGLKLPKAGTGSFAAPQGRNSLGLSPALAGLLRGAG